MYWQFYYISDFENLGRAFDKAKKVVDQEGMPRFYVRNLAELEDFVAEVSFVDVVDSLRCRLFTLKAFKKPICMNGYTHNTSFSCPYMHQGSHRLEKYLNLEGLLEKSLKNNFALKSTGKITQRP